MSARLNANQLDRAWDARILGSPFSEQIGEADDLQLLDLLAGTVRPAPPAAFVRSLERELGLVAAPESLVAEPATPVAPKPKSTKPVIGWWQRPRSRWMTAGYALAAIALVVFLSTFAITRQRSGLDNGPAIPAVSDWTDNGPPTSPGVETTTFFAQTFSAGELAAFGSDQWSWIELLHAPSLDPGQQWPLIDESNGTPTPGEPGLSVVGINSGTLTAHLGEPVLVSRAGTGTIEEIPAPAELVLRAGDAMVFAPGAVTSAWNLGSTRTDLVAGGLYDRPHYPTQPFFDTDQLDTSGGISFDSALFAGSPSLDLSFQKVSIAPGEDYRYAITPGMLLLADVRGDGLQKTAWVDGAPSGASQRLLVSKYSLHTDSPGDYTLTNTGSEPVDVYLFEVTGTPQAPSVTTPSAPVAETLFTQTLSTDELAARQSDNWNWIGMTQGTMQPGDRAVIVEGSPEPADVGFNGLGFVSVTSGELVANAAAGATVQRHATGASEPVDRSGNVTLEAGDTLIVPPDTLPAIWNAGETEATYLTAGVYTASNITPLNEMDSEFTRSGIRIDPNDLNVGEPLTMSLQQVSIPPGASFTYTVSSETWLEAVTQGGDLEQVKRIDGVAQGNAKTLVPSIYSLHMDGFGDYTLTNDGTETVEVSFFRVEAQGAPAAVASPVAQTERLVDQTLAPDQLAGFRIDDWKWIEFDRNVVPPQGGGQTVASLGKIPGQNPVPGLNLLAIESGTLAVAPDSDVTVIRGVDGTVESSPANAELTLAAGDALLYPSKTGGTFWNPSDTDTVVIGGGGYIRPAAPTFKLVNGNGGTSGAVAGAFGTGIGVTPGEILSSDPVSIAIERITISPDADTELTIDPTSWVVAVVEQGDLESTTTTTGGTPTAAVPLRQGEMTLPSSTEPQTVTLRNTGSDEAVIYVMRIGQ